MCRRCSQRRETQNLFRLNHNIRPSGTAGRTYSVRRLRAGPKLWRSEREVSTWGNAIFLGIVTAIVAASIVLTPKMVFVWLAGLIALVLLILAARRL
jgi:hypothetical protein